MVAHSGVQWYTKSSLESSHFITSGRNIAVNFWYFCHSEPLPVIVQKMVELVVEIQNDIPPQYEKEDTKQKEEL